MTADGILIIDKPADWTSHDVVAKVRKIVRTRRVGHTGTLDPFATGVLVICLNRATRLVQFLTGDDKEYLATMRLGFATDTGDFTGQPLSPVADAKHISRQQVEAALSKFRGRIRQIPPMYSAKKIDGVRLHELARRGQAVERKPIEVEIKELELLPPPENSQDSGSPLTQNFSFRVVCSSGTYIRTLAEDIGKQLQVGAHLTALRRTRAGGGSLTQSVTLERLAEIAEADQIGELLIPMTAALALPVVTLTNEERKAVLHGRSIKRQERWAGGAQAQLCDRDQQLVAIASYDDSLLAWRPRVVLAEVGG